MLIATKVGLLALVVAVARRFDRRSRAKLVYSAITSLDGYIEDRNGRFDWAVPDEEAHSYINDLERNVGTHLYGRRMYEAMAAWETDPASASRSPAMGRLRRHLAGGRESRLFVAPVAVGAGKRALPADVRLELAPLGLRRFDSGMLHLHYRVEA